MCGIYGEARHRNDSLRPGVPASVRATLALMQHRGPDAQHVVSRGNFVLGLARLAIVTTNEPEAMQPHVDERTGVVTALNGEVYNYRALDPNVRSEVALLSRMLQEGEDPRVHCDGDYAIAQFNPSTSRLTLYRDRFGVCPLYYQLAPYVAVSSEARFLLNPRRVPANGRVVIDAAGCFLVHCSVLPIYGMTQNGDERTVLSLLEDAVLSRATHTESGFSLALSGGLDSSLLAAVLVEVGARPKLALCTAFSARSDDALHAETVAEHFRIPFGIVRIPENEDMQHEALSVLYHLDAPANTITALRYQGALRSWFVAKHSPTRVILCGDGVDELVGGYASHAPRENEAPWQTARRRLSSLRSMQSFNLDRTNKMGMAHSREFRPPFLAASLSQALLALPWSARKESVRKLCRYYGVPASVTDRPDKYSPDEVARPLPGV